MKSIILVLLGLLLTISFASASYPYRCGTNSCQEGTICRIFDGVCNCIPINDCHDVSLKTTFIGTWVDGSRGNKRYTQYDVTITNNLNRDIKQIYISNDSTLRLRDNSNTSIWNIVRLSNSILALPSYQPSINAHASFTFGFIVEGTQPVNLNVLSVTF